MAKKRDFTTLASWLISLMLGRKPAPSTPKPFNL